MKYDEKCGRDLQFNFISETFLFLKHFSIILVTKPGEVEVWEYLFYNKDLADLTL